MGDQLIGRRQTMKYLGLLAASSAGQEFLAGWLSSASNMLGATEPEDTVRIHEVSHTPRLAEAAKPYNPQFFKPEEFKTVEILTEMIIPTDEKPGAKEAQVASFIDFVVFSAAEHEPQLQEAWRSGLTWLDQASKQKYGGVFREISAGDREQMLTETNLPERDANMDHPPPDPGYEFYRLVKEMTVEGFYTSRIGLLEVLDYQGLGFLSEFPGCTHPEHQF